MSEFRETSIEVKHTCESETFIFLPFRGAPSFHLPRPTSFRAHRGAKLCCFILLSVATWATCAYDRGHSVSPTVANTVNATLLEPCGVAMELIEPSTREEAASQSASISMLTLF